MVIDPIYKIIAMCVAPVFILFIYAGAISMFKHVKARLLRKNEELDNEL